MQSISTEQPFTEYAVRQVEFADIPKWLRQGGQDIAANPWSSLLYGIIFALVGAGMSLLSANNPGFFMATAAGFMLWGPFLALGLYDLSLRREHGDPVNFLKSTLALKRNPVNLLLYSAMLGVLVLLWLRMSSIVLDIFLQDTAAAEQHSYIGFMAALLGSKMGWLFTLSFMSVGLLFAVVSFVTGVATVPMLLERKVSLVTALNTSIRAILTNWKVMLVWAATIAVIIGAGLLPFSLGLIIAMPLISYASWHAYRDMVELV
ncbi:DUF2189 domain-containing protein [Thiothrix winogradskyi]|uniref:DUF2189 domain-containing protein n=1 Tax=Thiothrix winogradskyi TaxID=96472 RepID=A0ABY3SV47_9GAMM|nr:DUF2189 domain-containing protein [Thiothrix winogradskyi]UJS22769.1 DUF2189 domain-containing protein [Thiothrix winogradskyi]